MTHAKIVDLLPWYVNGTLSPNDRRAVETELVGCERCAAEAQALRKLHASLRALDAERAEPSPLLRARTLARIDAEPVRSRVNASSAAGFWRAMSLPGQVGIAASLTVAVLFGIGSVAQHTQPSALSLNEPNPVRDVAGGAVTNADKSIVTSKEPAGSGIAGNQLKKGKIASDAGAPTEALAPRSEQILLGVPQPAPALQAKSRVRERQLIRTAEISLLVPDVTRAIASVTALARTEFGDLLSLQDIAPTVPGLRHTAQLAISVPKDRFDATLEALGRMGGVKARTVAAEDATDKIVDLQARLRNLRRTETEMLKIMDRSGKVSEVLDVAKEISSVREEIEHIDGQLSASQHRVAYSTIAVALEDQKPVSSVEPSFGSLVARSWHAATQSLRGFTLSVIAGLLLAIAYLPYLLAAALVAFFLVRFVRHRFGPLS